MVRQVSKKVAGWKVQQHLGSKAQTCALSKGASSDMCSAVKMFLKPVWEGKIHGVTKIGIFRPLFCVNMLGKSTNYSTGTRPLCSTF